MEDCRPDTWKVYLYATIAVLLVSGASFIGAFTIPFIKKERFKNVMIFFMALAVGTMAADALLHLVPHMMNLHGHSHEVSCDAGDLSPLAQSDVPNNSNHTPPLSIISNPSDASLLPKSSAHGHSHDSHGHGHDSVPAQASPDPKHEPHEPHDDHDSHGHSHSSIPAQVPPNPNLEPHGDHDHHGHSHERRRKRRQVESHGGEVDSHEGHVHGGAGNGEKFDDHMGDHSHEHHDEEEEKAAYQETLWKLLVGVVTIYLFFLFESSARFYTFVIKKKASVQPASMNGVSNGLHHSNGSTNNGMGHLDNDATFISPNAMQMTDVEKGALGVQFRGMNNNDAVVANGIQTGQLPSGEQYHMYMGHSHHGHGIPGTAVDDSKKICGMKPVVFMIIFGGAVHNFADGLALGASFASSLTLGLSTTIALVCHEIPHELGDFATLLHTGLSPKMTLFLNGLSALPAVVGVYIAIGLSTLSGVLPWIFAVVLGTFIYISLVAILNELREAEPERTVLGFVLCNAGMIVGAAILVIIAFFE